ncbi:uncharacterized protein LTHEOB_12803 [Lasiodiplodia theobromae]|uniref:uncharacterized protein n=1 Tax=Lasiodiplodia theobromae TaxID=45133 RepID=UPI0015C3B4E4|nr:uncharacterized protein LTHEOB_12803 [Lasiodiplodia theobromae]KAF4535114.1 hypothetical protein LTHEOB_12803 [Lasiodiplodia theobromae]
MSDYTQEASLIQLIADNARCLPGYGNSTVGVATGLTDQPYGNPMYRAYLIVNSQPVAATHDSSSRLGAQLDLFSRVEKKLGHTLRVPHYQDL